MIPGLQTHIEGWTDPATLREVYAMGYRLARISAMTSTVDAMLEGCRDAKAAGLTPIVTIADPARIRLFQPGDHVECRNEDDGDIPANEYRRILDEMAAIALEAGVRLWGPTSSNTDEDSLAWGREVRDCGGGWPAGLFGVSWHSYGPYPHSGFKKRPDAHPLAAEFRWLKTIAGDKPILISEFGWANTTGTTEEQQADEVRALWAALEAEGVWGACLFQIHDGPNPNEREHRYGIRRCDAAGKLGDWKPVAFVVPQPTEGTAMSIVATLVISRKDLADFPGKPNCKIAYYPPGQRETVASCQGDGTIETRPAAAAGAWETLRIDGDRAVFIEQDKGTYAIPLVD